MLPINLANKISLEGNLESFCNVPSSRRSLLIKPFFITKSISLSSAYLNRTFVTCEGSSLVKTNPRGPVISSDNASLLDCSAANFAKVFLAILNFADVSFKALLNPLNSLTEVPL